VIKASVDASVVSDWDQVVDAVLDAIDSDAVLHVGPTPHPHLPWIATGDDVKDALAWVPPGVDLNARRVILEVALQNLRRQRINHQDRTTGLADRADCEARGPGLLVRAAAAKAPSSLIWFDVVGLKRWNDEHGHLTGDEVLRTVGNAVLATIRESDFAWRWGGDELLVLLPRAERLGAEHVVARVRNELQANPVAGRVVQVHAGVACSPPIEAVWPTLLAAADQAVRSQKSRDA
jgi:diguanylate cyclase (GGDEF)-like protein